MGKFGANRGGGGFRRNSGGGDREESRGGSSRGGGFSRGGNRGGGRSGGKKNNDDALKLGDISVSERVIEEVGDDVVDNLRDANIGMYVKIYPPKGVDEITIKRGDYLNIRLCKSKYGKERTVGFVTVSQSDE